MCVELSWEEQTSPAVVMVTSSLFHRLRPDRYTEVICNTIYI